MYVIKGIVMFVSWIQPFIAQHGYWVVFLIVMFESAGVPLPGETALVLAAVYAGATGQLDIGLVIGLAAVAAIVGDNIGFQVGRTWGLPLVRKFGGRVGLTEKHIALGDFLYARHGAKIIFFGRFVAFLRIFAALLAGVHGFPWWRFLIFNALGGVCWALVFGVGGYVFGDTIHHVTGPVGFLAFLGVLVGAGGMWWFAKRQEHNFMLRAAEELEKSGHRPPAPEKP